MLYASKKIESRILQHNMLKQQQKAGLHLMYISSNYFVWVLKFRAEYTFQTLINKQKKLER